MMWIPTIVCAGSATIGCLLGWQAAFDPPVRIREMVGLALFTGNALAGTLIAGAEAWRQSGWLQ